jgi:hypothetical protein
MWDDPPERAAKPDKAHPERAEPRPEAQKAQGIQRLWGAYTDPNNHYSFGLAEPEMN